MALVSREKLETDREDTKAKITQALSAAQGSSGAAGFTPLGSSPGPVGKASSVSEATFNKNLQKFIAASGGKITVTSGKRSNARQRQLWEQALKKYGSAAAARKWVAPPGRSKHEFGIASDLKFADEATRQWAHQNARQFGLHFPLGNEPWHVELTGSR